MGLEHWVWLGLALPPGSAKASAVLRAFPDPKDFFDAGEDGIAGVPELDRSDAIRIRAATLEVAESAIERAGRCGGRVICQADPEFPERLKNISSCPPVLYVLGSLEGMSDCITVAMVGSRNCSDYGRRAAAQISDGLARRGAVVVSGLAAGIDTVSHTACLDAGGRTVAVQGCGIGAVYPPENAALKRRIAENGAVISEFPPDAQPQSSFFPIRNRIVSGLSCGVVVVEAALRSGTSITAELAVEQGREVFAVPGDVFKPGSQGTLALLKAGAIPVSNAGDVLNVLSRRFPSKQGGGAEDGPEDTAPFIRKSPPEGITPAAAAIYSHLERKAKYVEELCAESGLSVAETASALTELEIYGLALHQPGRRFRLG